VVTSTTVLQSKGDIFNFFLLKGGKVKFPCARHEGVWDSNLHPSTFRLGSN